MEYSLFEDNMTNMSTSITNAGEASGDVLASKVAKYIWLTCSPILLIFGFIGNILCFLVTRRLSFRKSSVGFCFSALALADLLVLLTGLTRSYTKELSGWDFRNVNEWCCKLHRFFLYFGLDFSAWILVTVSLERFISVCHPFRARTMCTLSRTKKVLALVAFLVVLENVSVFWAKGREIITVQNGTVNKTIECGYPGEEQKFYWRHVRPYCVIGLYALGPFTTMIICSVRIVYQLKKAKRTMARVSSRGMSASEQSLYLNNDKALQKQRDSYQMHSMTIMSVVVAMVFLCLTTPSHLEFLLESQWNKDDPTENAQFQLFEVLTRMCLYTNHAINLVVYLASGKRFRKEFLTMIRVKRQRSPTSTSFSGVIQLGSRNGSRHC